MEALNPEIKSEQVQQPELLEPNDSRAAPPALLRLLLNVKTGVCYSRAPGLVWFWMGCVKLSMVHLDEYTVCVTLSYLDGAAAVSQSVSQVHSQSGSQKVCAALQLQNESVKSIDLI